MGNFYFSPAQALSTLMRYQKSPFCVKENPWLRLNTSRSLRIGCDPVDEHKYLVINFCPQAISERVHDTLVAS